MAAQHPSPLVSEEGSQTASPPEQWWCHECRLEFQPASIAQENTSGIGRCDGEYLEVCCPQCSSCFVELLEQPAATAEEGKTSLAAPVSAKEFVAKGVAHSPPPPPEQHQQQQFWNPFGGSRDANGGVGAGMMFRMVLDGSNPSGGVVDGSFMPLPPMPFFGGSGGDGNGGPFDFVRSAAAFMIWPVDLVAGLDPMSSILSHRRQTSDSLCSSDCCSHLYCKRSHHDRRL